MFFLNLAHKAFGLDDINPISIDEKIKFINVKHYYIMSILSMIFVKSRSQIDL